MKRPYFALLCALAVLLAGVGCSDSSTPETTHTPTPSQTISPSDNYHAGEDGQVEDGTYHTGSPGEDIGDAVDDAGDAVKDAARDAGDAVKDIADDAGRDVEKSGNALTGQR